MSEEKERYADTYQEAVSVQVYTCGEAGCGHPHLGYVDEEGKIFAMAVLPDNVIEAIYACYQELKRSRKVQ